MSWQGNDLFVMVVDAGFEYKTQMHKNMEALLDIYDTHGSGWYLLGDFSDRGCKDIEDEYDPFEPTSYNGSAPSCTCWLPNPFMQPGVIAMYVRCARDLLEAAFEGWDCNCDCFAYAGDGDEPLERMTIRGKTYDMRAA